MKIGLYGLALACLVWALPFLKQVAMSQRPGPLEGAALMTLLSLAALLCVEARRSR